MFPADGGEPQPGRHRRAPEKQASYREVLAIREFRGVWFAQVLSYAGDQFAQVAIAILVYRRTGSPLLTALAYALTYLPPIAGGPLLSGLADLFPRRRVMIVCDVIRAGLVAAMAVPSMPFAVLCGLLFCTVLLGAPFSSARSALLPDVLPGDTFVVGSAIGNISFQASQILGFVAGAAVVAALDPYRTLATDALSFALSAVIVAGSVKRRPSPHRDPGKRPSLWAVSREGLTMVFGSPVLRTLLLFGWLAGFCIVPEGLAAPYAHSLHGNALDVGLLMAAMPLGTVIGAFALGRLVPPSGRMRMMGWLAMASCAPLIGSAFNPPLWAVLVLWALAGAGGAYQLAAAAVFVQTVARGAARGRSAWRSRACSPCRAWTSWPAGPPPPSSGPRSRWAWPACWACARRPSSRWAGRCAAVMWSRPSGRARPLAANPTRPPPAVQRSGLRPP